MGPPHAAWKPQRGVGAMHARPGLAAWVPGLETRADPPPSNHGRRGHSLREKVHILNLATVHRFTFVSSPNRLADIASIFLHGAAHTLD